MLATLIVSLICNVLLLIFAIALRYEREMYKEFRDDWRRGYGEVSDAKSRLQDTVDIQAKRLLDIRKLTQT